ncbi:hypothetical protein CYMTET_3244 [Cymbomonas tetramitiformis]|uniref:Uncharacterized protein n=1 Tax=Cymbomonas tetramitiformis TaxID=36881 RepID=A0AAE0H3K1_9CHLO|nr:hypothetical protein CYMTET_3244 [Cymbomonas tetramitiformis]
MLFTLPPSLSRGDNEWVVHQRDEELEHKSKLAFMNAEGERKTAEYEREIACEMAKMAKLDAELARMNAEDEREIAKHEAEHAREMTKIAKLDTELARMNAERKRKISKKRAQDGA